jgi:fatty-acyl-CoA synthase
VIAGMMQQPLLVSSLLRHAERHHPWQEIVSARVEATCTATPTASSGQRTRRLANALEAFALAPGERVATLAWNGYRHMELYYAASGSGRVIHTLNPRLHPDQVVWIADHAEDRVLFFDLTFLPLVESIAHRVRTLRNFVVMTDRKHMPATTTIPGLLCYEDLLEGEPDAYEWPALDENDAATLCYTSGTTGNPKGVLYSHRSTVLHAFRRRIARRVRLLGARHHPARRAHVPRQRVGHSRTWRAWWARSSCSRGRGSTAGRCTSCSRTNR